VYCEPASLSSKAMDLARLVHWAKIVCLCGEVIETRLLAPLLEPIELALSAQLGYIFDEVINFTINTQC